MKSLLYIGNKLSRHGSNTTAIETLGPMLEREGFTVKYASAQKNKLLRLLDMVTATLRFAKSSDYVLIDTYSTSNFWYAFAVSQLCRLLRVKYVPILHGGELPKRLANNPHLCRMVFSHAFANIAPSGYLLDAFQRAGFSNVRQIPNAIATADYPFKMRAAVEPKLLWVRSFASIYNPEMALKVLAEVAKDFPAAQLCMVGPDKDGQLDKMRQMADAMGISVQFTGRLPKAEWIKISESYGIFINTTHYDNTPVSVIEAMALGLPVVSTNVGGLPFLLKDHETALLVGDGDHKKMASCIVNLVRDAHLTQKMVQNAHNLTREFDAVKVSALWLEFLK